MSSKNKKIIISLTLIIAIILSFLGGYFCHYLFMSKTQKAVYDLIKKYEKYYYFEDDNVVDIISTSILDEYSRFYTKEENEMLKRAVKGYSIGVGLSFIEDSLVIYEVAVNSPSFKAGITKNGEVQSILFNSQEKPLKTAAEFIKELNGIPIDTEFNLTIKYGEEIKIFTLKKQEYLQTYVSYKDSEGAYGFTDKNGELENLKIDGESEINNDKWGYIKYTSFNGRGKNLSGSVGQMEYALKEFTRKNKECLILDLRDNGGGYMDILCDISTMLVPSKKGEKNLIAYAKNKNGDIEEFESEKSTYEDYSIRKTIILANENSASASEVLIGAMLDYSKEYNNGCVQVILTSNANKDYKTYGKGIMQTTYTNFSGSSVKLTTAELFWPKSNVSIHKKGVTKNLDYPIFESPNNLAISIALTL